MLVSFHYLRIHLTNCHFEKIDTQRSAVVRRLPIATILIHQIYYAKTKTEL